MISECMVCIIISIISHARCHAGSPGSPVLPRSWWWRSPTWPCCVMPPGLGFLVLIQILKMGIQHDSTKPLKPPPESIFWLYGYTLAVSCFPKLRLWILWMVIVFEFRPVHHGHMFWISKFGYELIFTDTSKCMHGYLALKWRWPKMWAPVPSEAFDSWGCNGLWGDCSIWEFWWYGRWQDAKHVFLAFNDVSYIVL